MSFLGNFSLRLTHKITAIGIVGVAGVAVGGPGRTGAVARAVDRPVVDHDDVGRETTEGPRQGIKEIADDGSAVVGDDHDRDIGQDGGRPGER